MASFWSMGFSLRLYLSWRRFMAGIMTCILMNGTMLNDRLASNMFMAVTGMPCSTRWAVGSACGGNISSPTGHHAATTTAAAYLSTTATSAMNNSCRSFVSNSP
jgi:hypothetical protein